MKNSYKMMTGEKQSRKQEVGSVTGQGTGEQKEWQERESRKGATSRGGERWYRGRVTNTDRERGKEMGRDKREEREGWTSKKRRECPSKGRDS